MADDGDRKDGDGANGDNGGGANRGDGGINEGDSGADHNAGHVQFISAKGLELAQKYSLVLFAVIAFVLVILGIGLIHNHYPTGSVFEGLLALAGAALVFAFAVRSENVVVHVAGFLVVASLVTPMPDLLNLWAVATNDEVRESRLAGRFSRKINLDNHSAAQDIVVSLIDGGLIRQDLSTHQDLTDLTGFVDCMMDLNDRQEIAHEINARGTSPLLRMMYMGRAPQAVFRPDDEDSLLWDMDYLRSRSLVDYSDDNYQDARLTEFGCQVVKQNHGEFAGHPACNSWIRYLELLSGSPVPESVLYGGADVPWGEYISDEWLVSELQFRAYNSFDGESDRLDLDLRVCIAGSTTQSFQDETNILRAINVTPPRDDEFSGDRLINNLTPTASVERTIAVEENDSSLRWIRINLPSFEGQGWEVQLDLSPAESSGLLDPVLYVHDAFSRRRIAFNDDFGTSLNSRVIVQVESEQILLVGVRDYFRRPGQIVLEAALRRQPS